MEIYEDTYEKLSFLIKQREEEHKQKSDKLSKDEDIKKSGSLPKDEDDALDMFGNAFDEKISNKESG